MKKLTQNSYLHSPTPQVVPECFYAILYIGKGVQKYYTLELDIASKTFFKDGGGIICGQSGSTHLNYGRRCKPDIDAFQKSAQDIIDGKPYDEKEDFKNIDFEGQPNFLVWMKKN